jgi:hypothetical protein
MGLRKGNFRNFGGQGYGVGSKREKLAGDDASEN